MKTIYEYLNAYGKSDSYGFHMPGHKRNENMMDNTLPYGIDITEIDGFDDLHHADGIIKRAEERAAKLYHAEETHFLVNGSTVGILSAILGATEKGDKILAARNCHKSVYHAMYLNELEPVYIYPNYEKESGLNGTIEAEEIREALESDRSVRAVVIVSPTYDGVVSDVRAIAEVVHAYGIPLIVDEAHGAHFGFHSYFPENANVQGADLVIHSVHKTLPALTQTALIHMNGEIVQREKVRMYLHMLQSSSPSYVLMASIDECMELLEKQGKTVFAKYVERLEQIRAELRKMQYLKLVETEQYDKSKFVISVRNADITSRELSEILRQNYHLEMEMTAGDYVLAMTAIGDTEEGFRRLAGALQEIENSLKKKSGGKERKRLELREKTSMMSKLPRGEVCCTCAEILRRKQGRSCTWKESVGEIAMEYAYLYPPGIPVIVPGERVSEEAVQYLTWYFENGFSIEGLEKNERIKVWINE